MGKDWTKEELVQASKAMMANGQMGYEEFCEMLADGVFDTDNSEVAAETSETEVHS